MMSRYIPENLTTHSDHSLTFKSPFTSNLRSKFFILEIRINIHQFKNLTSVKIVTKTVKLLEGVT